MKIKGAIIKENKITEIKKSNEGSSLDQMLSQVDGSIFCLTRVAMIRALEIHSGSPAMVEHDSLDKASTIAFKEIAQGKISYKNIKPKSKESNNN